MVKNCTTQQKTHLILWSVLLITFLFLVPHQSAALSFKIVSPVHEEVIDASRPYVIKGEQEGVSDWSFDLTAIHNREVCHNDNIMFEWIHLPTKSTTYYSMSATTSPFEQTVDFSVLKDRLSEKISYKMEIETGYKDTFLAERIVRFENIPGSDLCDNPWFDFLGFSADSPVDTADGFGMANFKFHMAGVEKVVMNYGDGDVTEFPARGLGGINSGLFQHIYKKTGNYTVTAKVSNFKGDTKQRSLSFHVLAKASEPNLYIDSPVNGSKINGGTNFTVTWHSTNYPADARVNIALYKLDPEIRPEITNTGHVRTVAYSGPRVLGAADLATSIPNNGKQVVTMPLSIPIGQYLIGMYCNYPYPENSETCLNEKVPIEKIENVAVQDISQEVKTIQPQVTTEVRVVPANPTNISQFVLPKVVEISPVSQKEDGIFSEIQKRQKPLNMEMKKVKTDVKSDMSEKNEKFYSTNTIIKNNSSITLPIERKKFWQVISSLFKRIFSLN